MDTKPIEDIYPLSPMQQGMLFHALRDPDSGVYLGQIDATLTIDDPPAFLDAWRAAIERHPILRTSFLWQRDQPLQVVHRRADLPLTETDLRDQPAAEQQARIDAFCAADRGRDFDLERPPLLRLALFRLGPDRYRFVYTVHHVLLDGWSGNAVLHEVLVDYAARRAGRRAEFPPRRPFREYIAWLQRQDRAAAERFWRARLAGLTEPTSLGIDRPPRPEASGGTHYEAVERAIDPGVVAAAQALARRCRTTLNTVFQAAWALLLSRYSGQREVLFGATVSGRQGGLPGIDEMVGLLINTLPLRLDVPRNRAVQDWLPEVLARHAEAQPFAYSSLVEIQDWSEIPRPLPLFESILVFENYPVDPALYEQVMALEFHQVRGVEQTNYPLTVIVQPGPTTRALVWYDTTRFDGTAIERLLGHFEQIVAGLAAPEARTGDIDLLTPAERQQIVVEWNQTDARLPDRRAHEMLAEVAARQPDAPALIHATGTLTYRDLDEQSNRLAHALREHGAGPETVVGVCLDRSPGLFVALYGILKAGAAYLPLDATYPADRLAFMLDDSGAAVIVTSERLGASLPPFKGPIVTLDGDHAALAAYPATPPNVAVDEYNLAYVIYTSGSTGLPKGIMIKHRSVTLIAAWLSSRFAPDELARVLASTSVSWDLSVFEIYVPLCTGGALVIVENPLDLLAGAPPVPPTLVNMAPSVLAEVVRQGRSPSSVRTVTMSGEALPPALLAALHEQPGISRVLNLYGPSETTLCSTHADLGPDDVPSIGRPLGNTQIYLLDPNGAPVPAGVPGEVYIGGDGLARGYAGRPALTAEFFVPDPFSGQPGARLYRTGDLARYRPDGTLDFLGRRDFQVKVRGYRIEPGEVEAALAAHPEIRDAVVIAREDTPGDRQLTAYLVPEADAAPATGEVREFLQARLPTYLVPSAYVVLPELPRRPNGKLDRRALPAPDAARIRAESYRPPSTLTEQTLAAIWSEVLRVESPGIDDNFFDLGGHSLRATQVLARIEASFGRRIPLSALFERPTVAQLAAYLDALLQVTATPRPAGGTRTTGRQ